MKIKILLIASFLALTTNCANQPKKEVAQTTPVIEQKDTTSAKQTTTVTPTKSKNAIMIDAFTCTHNNDVREISIEPLTPKGCRLWYSNKKDGPAAQSAFNIEKCEKVSANIRKNLDAAGFKCEQVSDTSK